MRRQLTLCMAEVIVVEADLTYHLIMMGRHMALSFSGGAESRIFETGKRKEEALGPLFFNTLTITGLMRVCFCPYGRNHAHKDRRGGAKDTRFEPSRTDFLK